MKSNVHYVIEGILAAAIVCLFVMQLSGHKGGSVAVAKMETDSTGAPLKAFPVAYINVDSLLQKYNFSIDLNEQILKKQENARASYTQKARSLQAEVKDFQYKMQNGAFATRERAEQEQQRLMKKEQELQELDARLTKELMEQTQAMNEQLRDTVVRCLKLYNKDKGYQIIFSNTAGSPIFLADDVYNITGEIIEFLNKPLVLYHANFPDLGRACHERKTGCTVDRCTPWEPDECQSPIRACRTCQRHDDSRGSGRP